MSPAPISILHASTSRNISALHCAPEIANIQRASTYPRLRRRDGEELANPQASVAVGEASPYIAAARVLRASRRYSGIHAISLPAVAHCCAAPRPVYPGRRACTLYAPSLPASGTLCSHVVFRSQEPHSRRPRIRSTMRSSRRRPYLFATDTTPYRVDLRAWSFSDSRLRGRDSKRRSPRALSFRRPAAEYMAAMYRRSNNSCWTSSCARLLTLTDTQDPVP